MPYLSKKRVWTQQPQTRQQLNPIFSDRLIALVVPGQPEYFGGGLPVISGVGKIVPARAGIAAKAVYNGAGANEVRWPVNLSFSGDYTFSVFSSNEDQIADLPTFYISGTTSNNIAHGNAISSALIDNNNSPTITTTASYTPRLISARRRSNQCSVVVDKTASSESVTGTRDQVWTALNVGRDGASNSVGTTNYLIAVWNRYVSNEVLFALSENPWRLLKKQDRRIWIPSAGGGVHTTTSILTSDVATISGTSLHKILHTVVGNLTSSAATLTGTSVHTTPSPTHNTVGVLSASNSSITGIAARYREHQTNGILTTTNATINGTTNNFSVITSTGVLSSDVATLAGVMSITPAPGIHISTGVLQSNSATITGILTHTATGHTLTGTLVSSVATLNGNVAHNTIHSSSGTLVSSVATINGTASSSGIMTLTSADIEAIANAVWQHPWALTLPKWLALK